ncbi:cilia- and flagella-associated protein 58 [Drosophila grimshawi]|uniref:Dynein regulatory complex protein 10 n=1 Tax=Drosophila grimshawi TaxID=7222 RepID=B4JUL0_DROGR|nr:cilia- and flagella-associated protein 58 [Drosophila grimshawi]EDV91180.1 GH15566 [Drosophila grimshawi]
MSKPQNDDIAVIREAIHMAQLDFSSLRITLIENVMRAMMDAYERVKISLILPKLIENRGTLVKVVTGTRYVAAIPLLDDFFRRRDIILREQRPPLEDHGMIRIIDYFQRNSSMYQLFPRYMHYMPQEDRKFLNTFAKLLEMARAHLERDAKTQIQQERYLQSVCKDKEKLMGDMQIIESKKAAYKVMQQWKSASKAAKMAKIEEDMRIKVKRHEEIIQREADRCRRIVLANEKESKEKQVELVEEVEKERFINEKLTKDYKKLEKEARDEKNKLQIQLEGIIKKYDTVIGEKIVENLELMDQLNEAKKALDDFMVIYRMEAAIYNEIVVKREKEEERRKQAAILKYMMHRAAVKIQQYWRAWRRHMAKKARKENKRAKKK